MYEKWCSIGSKPERCSLVPSTLKTAVKESGSGPRNYYDKKWRRIEPKRRFNVDQAGATMTVGYQ